MAGPGAHTYDEDTITTCQAEEQSIISGKDEQAPVVTENTIKIPIERKTQSTATTSLAVSQSGTEEVVRYINQPDTPYACGFIWFQAIIAVLKQKHFRVAPSSDPSDKMASLVSLAGTNGDVKIGVDQKAAGAGAPPASGASTPTSADKIKYALTYTLDKPVSCAQETSPAPRKRPGRNAAAPNASPPEPPPGADVMHVLTTAPAAVSSTSPQCTTVVVIRSPESILFYLGELITVENYPPPKLHEAVFTPRVPAYGCENGGTPGKPAPDCDPMFVVKLGSPQHPPVSVDFENETYYIPRKDAGRSMQMLELLQQLVALQKKGTTLPTIPTVQLIGQ
jgi:hypothetical protein